MKQRKCSQCQQLKDELCFDRDYNQNFRKSCKSCLERARRRYHLMKEAKIWGAPTQQAPTMTPLQALEQAIKGYHS